MIASPDALIRIRINRVNNSAVGAGQREFPGVVRSESHIIRRCSVIGILQADEVVLASRHAGQEHGQVVCLGARINEIDILKVTGQSGR